MLIVVKARHCYASTCLYEDVVTGHCCSVVLYTRQQVMIVSYDTFLRPCTAQNNLLEPTIGQESATMYSHDAKACIPSVLANHLSLMTLSSKCLQGVCPS